MCQFIETLCVQRGKVQHLKYHQDRVNQSRREVLGIIEPLVLADIITVPDSLKQRERIKCRLLYSASVEEITLVEYQLRTIRSLRLLDHHTIEYPYKFANRDQINELFVRRGDADDILIVKQGLITDTSYSNVAFYDEKQWVTPHQPLLPGTCRARLLEEGVLVEKKVTPDDLAHFTHCSLINAMLPLGECKVTISDIRWYS
uniref:Aminotransferase class IV family protein n=1 Tax=Roseihalotalea indica TaxID=2867963 RepID=A0AA49JJV3_9BACT|nr:aminotransferase class IV family protein [Tunicatimonas sp. TK19036]